jgi:hypothetical protein
MGRLRYLDGRGGVPILRERAEEAAMRAAAAMIGVLLILLWPMLDIFSLLDLGYHRYITCETALCCPEGHPGTLGAME